MRHPLGVHGDGQLYIAHVMGIQELPMVTQHLFAGVDHGISAGEWGQCCGSISLL